METKPSMKIFLIPAILFAVFFVFGNEAKAAEYYVSPSGSDSSSGLSGAPFKTIQKAADTVNPGDTVYVRAGIYNERITLTRSGSSGAYITFQNYPEETAIMDGTGLGDGVMFKGSNISYIKVIGFKITKFIGKGIAFGMPIPGQQHSHIEIRNNIIHDNTGYTLNDVTKGAFGIEVGTGFWIHGATTNQWADIIIDGNTLYNLNTGGNEALTLHGNMKRFQITNNTLHTLSNICIDMIGKGSQYPEFGIVSGNTVYNCGIGPLTDGELSSTTGIYIDFARNITIENNIIQDGNGIGIYVGIENWWHNVPPTTDGIIIRRNRAWRNKAANISVGGGYLLSDVDGVTKYHTNDRVVHNTMLQDTKVGANGHNNIYLGSGTGHIAKNNIVYNDYNNVGGPSTVGHNPVQGFYRNVMLDYNLYYTPQGSWKFAYGDSYGAMFPTFEAYKSATGQDAHTLTSNPLFTNVNTNDFTLQSNSPAIDAGDFLTRTSGGGTGTTITVLDARYFHAGYGIYRDGVAVPGDTIKVGSNTVTVTGVNYTTNTLTVTPSITWVNGEGVSYVYSGAKPDMGAYEYVGTKVADTIPPAVPTALAATSVSSIQNNLSWTASTDNVGVTGYKVYRNGTQIDTTSNINYSDTGLLPSTTYTYTVSAYDAAGNNSDQSSPASATTNSASVVYLSDITWISATNGWGPVEKDKSNGENAAGDGKTITLNGTTYTKGLGVHVASDVQYNLAGKYSTFMADIGVDDEVGSYGSVIFQVFADGVKLYDSGTMTGSTPTKQANVDITGKNTLQLVVTDAGNGNTSDHADWANARIIYADTTPPAAPTGFTVQ